MLAILTYILQTVVICSSNSNTYVDNPILNQQQGQQTQFQLSIISCQFQNQTTNAISSLDIQFSSELLLSQHDQLIVQLDKQDYGFDQIVQQLVCHLNKIQMNNCFSSKGSIYIIVSDTNQLDIKINQITIQNHVSMRSLKQSQLRLMVRRQGYQIAQSNDFAFQVQYASQFLLFGQQVKQYPLYNNYRYQIRSQTTLLVGEVIEILLPFLLQRDYVIQTSMNCSHTINENVLQIVLQENILKDLLYNIQINNVDQPQYQQYAYIVSKTSDQFTILQSVYQSQQQINILPGVLPKFINSYENNYIDGQQNNIYFTFQSNVNLLDQKQFQPIPIHLFDIKQLLLNNMQARRYIY